MARVPICKSVKRRDMVLGLGQFIPLLGKLVNKRRYLSLIEPVFYSLELTPTQHNNTIFFTVITHNIIHLSHRAQ